MPESVFHELKRYTGFDADDEAGLRRLHPLALPHLVRVSETFYDRILQHPHARTALEGGESQVGRLKVTLVAWMDTLLTGPWDEAYFERRCRIGRVHVRIALPQHYMFGAMNVIRTELGALLDASDWSVADRLGSRRALGRILDLELAIMLHTYREDLLEQQARTARLATFGQLVGSIGHELRNPLGVIESSLYILQGRMGDDPRAQKHVARIGEQVQIANDIVSSLLDMIRDRPLVRERLQLATVVESALEVAKPPAGVRIEASGLEGLAVEGDATQLRQVVLNLIENALHAAGEQGWVHVEGAAEGERVVLAVEDSGAGLAESVVARLFEPLVTTKVKGIGLGLALVKRIVERHGGTVAHAPRANGARFVVSLPRSR